MRKMKRNLVRSKLGAVGVGTMVVFIAMVLVAGIAANILIQTSSNLQVQATRSGTESVEKVANGVRVERVIGYNESNSISLLAIGIRALCGSSDIDLSEAILELSDGTTKKVLTYGGQVTSAEDVNGNLFNKNFYPNASTSTKFYIIVLQDEDSSCKSDTPIINYGDHVMLAVNATACFNGIEPRTKVAGKVMIPKGAPGIIGFTTPASYTTTTMYLQ